jgi:release factor glutamine methyltransferase
MTIKEALALGRNSLIASPSPFLDTRLILESVMAVDYSYLIAHDKQSMSPDQEHQYLQMLDRASAGEPIPYLTGRIRFFGLDLIVSPAVLIPRPETEQLVELALEWLRVDYQLSARPFIVDIGTGSGCIALALASQLPEAKIEATDVSEAALDIAKENAQALEYDRRIEFHLGSFLEPILGEPNLIVANLPYIADHEWSTVGSGVKSYEPDIALRGGSDGLDSIRQLLVQTNKKLARGGAIFLEIGWQQGVTASSLVQSTFSSAQVMMIQDYAGHDRIICVYT